MSVKIIADTGMDLTQDLISKYDIELLNVLINDGENEYTRAELSSDQVFEGLKEGKLYKTSQVSSFDYEECFERHAKNKDEVIYIALSSGLSGSYESAVSVKNQIVEKYQDAKLYVYDSKAASYGLGILVAMVAKMAKDNKSFDYIVDKLQEIQPSIEHYFAVTDLKYLVRGGRLSATAATVGKILSIKPILSLKKEDGSIYNCEKVRGEKSLYKNFFDKYLKNYEKLGKEQTIFIVYGDDIEAAKLIKEKIIDKIKIDANNIRLAQVGNVIGCHTGPGFIGIFYSNKDFDQYNLF